MESREIVIRSTKVFFWAICILLAARKNRASTEYPLFQNYTMNLYLHKKMSRLVMESSSLEVKDFISHNKTIVICKNMSPDAKQSQSFLPMVVLKDKDIHRFSYNMLCVRLHSEKNQKSLEEKDWLSKEKTLSIPPKKLLIVPYFKKNRDKLISLLKVIRDKESTRYRNVLESIGYIKESLNLGISKLYINFLNILGTDKIEENIKALFFQHLEREGITKKSLGEIGLKDTFAYELLSKELFYYGPGAYKSLCKFFNSNDKLVNQILDRRSLVSQEAISYKKQREIFDKDTEIFDNSIYGLEERCLEYPADLLKYAIEEQSIMFMNILTNGEIFVDEYKDIEDLKESIDPWNIRVFDLLISRIEYYSTTREDLDTIKEKLEADNKTLIHEIKVVREELFNECKDISILGHVYKWKNDEIKSIFERIYSSYSTKDVLCNVKLIDNDIQEIIDILFSSLPDYMQPSTAEQMEAAKRKREKINSALKEVSNIVAKYSNINDLECYIKEIEEGITASLLDIKLFSTNCSDVAALYNLVRRKTESIVYILISQMLKKSGYRRSIDTAEVNKKIAEEHKKIKYKNPEDALSYLHEFYSEFFYDLHTSVFSWRYGLYQYFTKPNKDFWIHLDGCFFYPYLSNVFNIYKEAYMLNDYVSTLKSYDEVWSDLAFLFVSKVDFSSEERSAYIIYSTSTGQICEKVIPFTDEALRAFKEASTLEAIESIEGLVIEDLDKYKASI